MIKLHPNHFAWLFAGFAGIAIYKYVKASLKSYLVEHTTVLNDLPVLGTPRRGKKLPGTAVICGGSYAFASFLNWKRADGNPLCSLAGLLAARICSDHFEDVLIIEPEAWLAGEEGAELIYDENGVPRTSQQSSRTRIVQYNSVNSELLHFFTVPFFEELFIRYPFPSCDGNASAISKY